MRIAGVGHASHVRSCFPIKTRSYPAAVPRPVSCSRLRHKFSVIVYRASPCDQTIAPERGKASPFRTLQCFSAIVACCSLSDAEVGGWCCAEGGDPNAPSILTSVFLDRARLPSQRVGATRAASGGAAKRAKFEAGFVPCQAQPPANYRRRAGSETACLGWTTWTVLRCRREPLSKTLS